MNNFPAGTAHFDPYQGLVDSDKELNLRFGFMINSINCLVNKSVMCEVVNQISIHALPNTPSWILGLINLRGILLPVFDIRTKLFSMSDTLHSNRQLLIIDSGSYAFGLYADGLPVTLNADDIAVHTNRASINDFPDIIKKNINEIYIYNNQIWHEIDYRALVTELAEDYCKPLKQQQ